MSEKKPTETLDFWVLSAANRLERAANEVLGKHGITYRQVQVLGALSRFDGLSQVELSDLLLVERSTLVRILDRMERDGWVERLPAPGDRRKNIIRQTPKVEPVWKTIMACGTEIRQRATRGIPAGDLDRMMDVLSRLCDNLAGGR